MDVSGTSGPIKGKLLVPLTEAEKIEKRRRKAKGTGDSTGCAQGSQRSQASQKASQGSKGTLSPEAPPDPDPVDFAHIQTAGRNYAVLQVGGGVSYVGARSYSLARQLLTPKVLTGKLRVFDAEREVAERDT